MRNVVITGSTRGIGYGVADALLERGCTVTISGRSQENVDKAVEGLVQKHGPDRVLGLACDVSNYAQVQALWDTALERWGEIDIWINNAGQSNLLAPFWELEPEKMQEVVNTNILGSMYGSKVAIQGMLKQGHGWVYNMEGYGSHGKRRQPGLTLYGTTKAALAFFDESLLKDLEGRPVKIGSIQPGMVVTDMLYNQRSGNEADWERSKQAFNILADKVETAAPWIASRVLENEENGAHLQRVSGMTIMLRFLTAPFKKRNVID
jgi:NAD(P)-dependent dehydrogenase (short-subunit alcohol dehydrogenase family)